mmetsp:Transcript_10834/g.31315  ORF Transcript_10834/g.31315 Transcript_10834/m.31315 type:complete len:221 (-) Transcript_10834:193-855(-)
MAPTMGEATSLVSVPDDILIAVIEAHPERHMIRAISPKLRALVEENFQLRHYEPPAGKSFIVDLEINQYMTKHLYCAKFFCEGASADGNAAGAVTFQNWIPAYHRSNPNSRRDIRYRLGESDACMLWRTIAKVRQERAAAEADAAAAAAAAHTADIGSAAVSSEGHLTVTEDYASGAPDCQRRQVFGFLSAHQTGMMLSVLDHRRNAAAEMIPRPAAMCA